MNYKTTNIEDRLVYDKGTHRFSLYAERMIELLPELSMYGDVSNLQVELDNQSELLYKWIYNQIPNGNIPYVELILATNKSCLEYIYSALYEILKGDLHSGNAQARLNLGVNYKTGLVMDKNDLRESLITESVKMKIENIPGNLLTSRSFNIYLSQDRYERWDY